MSVISPGVWGQPSNQRRQVKSTSTISMPPDCHKPQVQKTGKMKNAARKCKKGANETSDIRVFSVPYDDMMIRWSRRSLHFWHLNFNVHCHPSTKSSMGQHSHFLRCFTKNQCTCHDHRPARGWTLPRLCWQYDGRNGRVKAVTLGHASKEREFQSEQVTAVHCGRSWGSSILETACSLLNKPHFCEGTQMSKNKHCGGTQLSK